MAESTKGKSCPVWAQIESLSKNQGVYATECDESCAKYSMTFNTCIDFAEKQANIQKTLAKYK